ncbi:MAG: hypothetical protein C3F06_01355 [Candidatus Methanoperedenaceae archaeon]|nr:MAG: hypothetical protein C3F06_01355 [Candidatus Methanoperedenaceae archaeon]
MLIQKILISPKVSEKIKYKHGLDSIVTKDILEGNRNIEKVGGSNYMAIGLCSNGYITVFFEYEEERN